jgi:hypothetical protein
VTLADFYPEVLISAAIFIFCVFLTADDNAISDSNNYTDQITCSTNIEQSNIPNNSGATSLIQYALILFLHLKIFIFLYILLT